MKTLLLVLVALNLGSSAVASEVAADDHLRAWFNRPNVVRAAERLAFEIEAYDEALHAVNAPTHVIQKVHHFEETALEFVQLTKTASYQECYQEMNHIRQDFGLIRTEMNAHPYLLSNYKVNQEFQHVRTAYRALDHEMFVYDSNRYSADALDQLEKDLIEMDNSHR